MSNKIEKILENIDARISHIEDMAADHRDIIIKLVKQSNNIVAFLKQLELHEVSDEGEFMSGDNFNIKDIESEKLLQIKELLEEFKSKSKDLQELEQELKKHKNDITPGQIGEA
tara:strand:- start:256 stop:597 length:342 start_codon:yes stop_codon:yes gene_type:complete